MAARVRRRWCLASGSCEDPLVLSELRRSPSWWRLMGLSRDVPCLGVWFVANRSASARVERPLRCSVAVTAPPKRCRALREGVFCCSGMNRAVTLSGRRWVSRWIECMAKPACVPIPSAAWHLCSRRPGDPPPG